MNSSVIFLKCSFCQKSFNKDNLIDVSCSSVHINDENIEIKKLIFDTCCVHVDEIGYICNGCNNNLVSFHMFKRDVKKYSNFSNYIDKLEILSSLEKFLELFNDPRKLKITKDSTKWCIQQDNPNEEIIIYDPEMIDNGIYEESTARDDLIISPDEDLNNESIVFPAYSDVCDKKSPRTEESQIKIDESAEEIVEVEIPEYDSQPKAKRRKLNSMDDLQPNQLEWIRKQVAESVNFKGKRKFFKCSVCQVVLCTQPSLVRHLRDVHLLKDPNDEKLILKQEVEKSKLIVETINGEEVFWKCFSCEQERIYKSEQAFKLHFRMNHIRETKIDSSYIANCKTKLCENKTVKEAWKCPECERIFKHRDGLRNHLKIEHKNKFDNSQNEYVGFHTSSDDKSINENICNECGVKFSVTKQHVKPRIHRECHSVYKVIAPFMPHYKCDRCRIVFSTEASLFKHLEDHDNTEASQLIPVDGLLTFGASYYKNPVSDVNESCLDEAVWKCGHCSVKYFEENDCVVHQLLLHSLYINCFIDNREFRGKTGLNKYLQHMKNKHPELFPNITYACGSCKLEFPSIYEKLAHQKLCNSKKYECDYCSKRYLTKNQLQAHILFEVGITGYSCEKCGKKCKTMSDLRIHSNIHTGLRPYECSLCEKSFKTPAARSSHMEKHTIEEGITCEICGAKLTNRTLYQRHKRFQHDKEFQRIQYEKNSCSLCDKSFLRNSHYKQHLKQQHGID